MAGNEGRGRARKFENSINRDGRPRSVSLSADAGSFSEPHAAWHMEEVLQCSCPPRRACRGIQAWPGTRVSPRRETVCAYTVCKTARQKGRPIA